MPDERLEHKGPQRAADVSAGYRGGFQFDRLLDILPAAAYTCDQEGLITYFNQRAAELWGRPPALNNPIDRFCGSFKLFSPEGIPLSHDQCWMALALREQKAFNGYEIVIERPDGTRIYTLAHANPIRDTSGQLLGAVNILTDISDQKRAGEDRRHLEAALHAQKWESLRILAGGVAHDFNNLLMSMLGYAQLALMEMPSDSAALPMLKEIELAAYRAADLAKQMLIYAGRGKFVIETLRLDILVQEMSKLMETVISKNAALHLDLAPATIKGDSTQIRQVVMNLITNASDALGDRRGVIWIRTGCFETDRQRPYSQYFPAGIAPGRYGFVEVEDDGCGMTNETLDRLFDPFFSTKHAGKGLGLAAALGIVKGHSGSIEIDSTPGEGTTFKVLLPSVASSLDDAMIPPVPDSQHQGGGVVLVIDDEDSVRTFIRRALERAGFQVRVASDGREGLDIFCQFQTEIVAVLLDLTMPCMDSVAVFQQLRLIKSDIPILVMSGYSESDITARFAGIQVAAFIQKPIHPSTLASCVHHVVLSKDATDAQP